MLDDHDPDGVLAFPAEPAGDPVQCALDELELVYSFIFSRVGNRPDAEDLTQQVAMKALPRLRQGASPASIRGYLFATARSVLGDFWGAKLGPAQLAQEELDEESISRPSPSPHSELATGRAHRILAALPANYRRVLELRFLRGYSIKEVAAEVRASPGSVKVMQLGALRAAARVKLDV